MKKAELLMGIMENVYKIKNNVALEELYGLTDIVSRKFDHKRHTALTDDEWEKASIVSLVMQTSSAETLMGMRILYTTLGSQ